MSIFILLPDILQMVCHMELLGNDMKLILIPDYCYESGNRCGESEM
jgi:hypothetical protein